MAQEITQGLFSNLFETKIPRMGTQSSPFGGILQQQPITISGGGMSPMSAITQRIMQSGEQLQGSVRGLFGQQTPEQAQQTMVTQLIKNNPDVNLNEPEGLRRMAREAMNVPGLEMFSIKLRQQADVLEEKQKVAKRTATKEELTIQKLEKEIETMGIPKPNVLPDSEMLIAQGLGIPTNDKFGNPRDITSYTQEESNAIMKKREEQMTSVARAGSNKRDDISMKEIFDFKENYDLNVKGDTVSKLEAINEIENLLQEAPKAGVGGAVIPQLQRAFIKLSEGSSARVSDKDVERILGVENFVDTRITSLQKFISGTLSDKKIQSLKELVKVYKTQSIKNYNTRAKAAKEDVNRVAFNKNKKDSLINSIPPVEFYLKRPTESEKEEKLGTGTLPSRIPQEIPVEQTEVILKEIEGVGTVRIKKFK